MEDNLFYLMNTILNVIMVGCGSATLVLSIYNCITIAGWWHCYPHRDGQDQRAQHGQALQLSKRQDMLELQSLKKCSTSELRPAHKYQKKKGFIVNDGGICTVCLSQFEEGEELRTLPECKHSYHAPCIDMWLDSNSSCPICRSNVVTPLPQIVHLPSGYELTPPASGSMHLGFSMLHNMVQSQIM